MPTNHPRDTGRQSQEVNPLTTRLWRPENSSPRTGCHSAVDPLKKCPDKPTLMIWPQDFVSMPWSI
jgi:hypothetical protein